MGLVRRSKTYWLRIQHDGKRIQESLKTNNRRLAEKIHAKILTEIIEGRYFEKKEDAKHTFSDMMTRFMREQAVNREISTQRRYKGALSNLDGYFHSMTLEEITPKVITAYIEKRRLEGATPATRNREVSLLSTAFNVAVKQWEWCQENPCSKISKEPENNIIDRWLTREEEEWLLTSSMRHLGGQLREIIILVLNTGLRLSEIINLKWKDIDFPRKILIVSKTKNKVPKQVPLNKIAYELLLIKSKTVNITGYVFCTAKGTQIMPRNLQREFAVAVRKAGIENFRFHDLRHTFATRLAQNGVDLYAIAKLLGHKDISTTQRYAHHSPESLRPFIDVLTEKWYKNGTIGNTEVDLAAANPLK